METRQQQHFLFVVRSYLVASNKNFALPRVTEMLAPAPFVVLTNDVEGEIDFYFHLRYWSAKTTLARRRGKKLKVTYLGIINGTSLDHLYGMPDAVDRIKQLLHPKNKHLTWFREPMEVEIPVYRS